VERVGAEKDEFAARVRTDTVVLVENQAFKSVEKGEIRGARLEESCV